MFSEYSWFLTLQHVELEYINGMPSNCELGSPNRSAYEKPSGALTGYMINQWFMMSSFCTSNNVDEQSWTTCVLQRRDIPPCIFSIYIFITWGFYVWFYFSILIFIFANSDWTYCLINHHVKTKEWITYAVMNFGSLLTRNISISHFNVRTCILVVSRKVTPHPLSTAA